MNQSAYQKMTNLIHLKSRPLRNSILSRMKLGTRPISTKGRSKISIPKVTWIGDCSQNWLISKMRSQLVFKIGRHPVDRKSIWKRKEVLKMGLIIFRTAVPTQKGSSSPTIPCWVLWGRRKLMKWKITTLRLLKKKSHEMSQCRPRRMIWMDIKIRTLRNTPRGWPSRNFITESGLLLPNLPQWTLRTIFRHIILGKIRWSSSTNHEIRRRGICSAILSWNPMWNSLTNMSRVNYNFSNRCTRADSRRFSFNTQNAAKKIEIMTKTIQDTIHQRKNWRNRGTEFRRKCVTTKSKWSSISMVGKKPNPISTGLHIEAIWKGSNLGEILD